MRFNYEGEFELYGHICFTQGGRLNGKLVLSSWYLSHSLLIRRAGLDYVPSLKENVYGDNSDTLRLLKVNAVLNTTLITILTHQLPC